jgi:hypothetical protein
MLAKARASEQIGDVAPTVGPCGKQRQKALTPLPFNVLDVVGSFISPAMLANVLGRKVVCFLKWSG